MIWLVINKKVVYILLFTLSITFFSGLVDKVERKLYGIKSGVYLEDLEMTGYLTKEVREAVKNLAFEKNKEPRNARFDRETGEIISGVKGIKINVDKTVEKVVQAKKNYKIKLITEYIHPKYNEDDISKLSKEIGSFVTGVGGTEERYSNVQLATKGINYYILFPGQVFSFNRIVGPRTVERGYRLAPIMNEGGTFLGPGGGVCQVSSTLYNAVINSGLKIVERHQHARPVGYVPPGMDATVDFAWLDLKFLNNKPYPVVIRGVAENRTLRIWVNGPADDGDTPKQDGQGDY